MTESVILKLYEIIRQTAHPSDVFEQLCQCLLVAMGFQRVYRHRGTEHGRDIDAELLGMKWFFECKFVQDDVDTAQFAYKFLQLDMLKKSQRPDFFVLLSNGGIKSILKDIVQFKASDKYTTYRVELWANHDSDRAWDDILLSCSDHVREFFYKTCPEVHGLPFWDIFLRTAQDHVRSNRRFIDRLLDTPLFRSRMTSPKGQPSSLGFACDATVSKVCHTNAATYGCGVVIVMVAVPEMSRFGLLPCSSLEGKTQLVKEFRSWGMEMDQEHDSSVIVFTEALSIGGIAHTLMCEWGAIATWEQIPFASMNSVLPSELFPLIKEHSVRLRNFMKRGTLATPCAVWLRVHNFRHESQQRLFGYASTDSSIHFRTLDKCYLGQLDPFEKDFILGPLRDDLVAQGPIVSDYVKFRTPPEDYSLIGGPLAESLWSKVSGMGNLLGRIRSIEGTLKSKWLKGQDRRSWDCLVELRRGFDYLLDEDLFPRPYDVFKPDKS